MSSSSYLTSPPSEDLEPISLTNPSTWSIHLPRRLLILPPVALTLGIAIGMSRGGSKARLRFLAENAHRQPTTIQGWYFYTKTRNYRTLFGALRQGSKDGLLLASATTLYVLVEEGLVKTRKYGYSLMDEKLEQKQNQQKELLVSGGSMGSSSSKEKGKGKGKGKGKEVDVDWDSHSQVGPPKEYLIKERSGRIEWLDGGIAGGVLGVVISVIYRFPPPLLLRSTILGTLLGTFEGTLRIAQNKLSTLRAEKEKEKEEERSLRVEEVGGSVDASAGAGARGEEEVSGLEVGECVVPDQEALVGLRR